MRNLKELNAALARQDKKFGVSDIKIENDPLFLLPDVPLNLPEAPTNNPTTKKPHTKPNSGHAPSTNLAELNDIYKTTTKTLTQSQPPIDDITVEEEAAMSAMMFENSEDSNSTEVDNQGQCNSEQPPSFNLINQPNSDGTNKSPL